MRVELHSPSDKAFEAVEHLGAVISEPQPGQRHIGILFKLENGPATVCDLAWHKIVRAEPPSPSDFWLQSSLDETNRRVVASAVAGSVAVQKPPISYSPLYNGMSFEAGTLKYEGNAAGEGLTCATFVLAIFESLGFPLLVRDTWQQRPSDLNWQESIVVRLEEWAQHHQIDIDDHLAAIRSAPKSMRYRPEEVAAGVADFDSPLDFAAAQSIGGDIVRAMQQPPNAPP